MLAFLYTIHVVICIFLIMVVLLQQGKGADLSVFGGGGTMTAFGARGSATLLHKLTVTSFVLFILTTLAIGIVQNHRAGATVMGGVAPPAAETTPAEAEEPPASEPAAEQAPEAALPEATPTDAAEGTGGEPAPEATGEEAGSGS